MLSNLQSGGALGRYPILGRIAESQDTLLLLSKHPMLGFPVTLKTSRFQAQIKPDVEDHLLREAHFLGVCKHTNVLKIYDAVKTDDGQCFLVLGALPERTLREYMLRYNPLPLSEILLISRQLVDLMENVHSAKVVLRALSPGQIGISRDSFLVTLFDMSAAASVTRPTEPLPAGLFSKSFVAPELKAGLTSTSADLYSLGVILFEMMSGESLPNSTSASLPKEAKRILKKRKDISAELGEIVARLLSPVPSVRPLLQQVRALLQ